MYRGYILYGLLITALFGYGQYHGWSLGGSGSDSSRGGRGGGWHWTWGGGSGSSGGGGFHK